MAIFTAIATAIVGAIGLTGVVATIATGVIATGLGFATAKLLGITDRPSAGADQQRDPGVKIQLPPATDNKVPRFYGRNFAGGIIIDAAISNQNKTMTYAIVISEYNTNDTWSVNKIYRGDAELVFGSSGSEHIVQSLIDPNSTTTTDIAGKMRCRVYAGGSGSANQIFPSTGTPANAYDMFPGWTSGNTMTGLVFAIFEMDYDSENGLTGLDAITFDINNALNEPSNVLLDYIQHPRYGANIDISLIDTDSFNAWNTFATTTVSYFDTVANTTMSHQRYQIDGALSTFDTTKTNINKICQAGGAFFTYNNKTGKFGVVPNRAASNAELANAFVFSDDNIISQIKVSSTDLFNLYNKVEVEYPSVLQRDQTDTVFIQTSGSLLHPNEPENILSYRLDMVNDRSRVSELANIDLKQSRINTILEFTADYSAMQVDVGDVVKVDNTPYGYNDKLFRVMRTTEVEDDSGMLSVNLILLEYDNYIYEDIEYTSDAPVDTSGISNWVFVNGNATPIIGNVTVSDNPMGGTGNANVFYSGNANLITTINIDSFISTNNVSYGNATPFVSFPITFPANATYDRAIVNIVNTSTATSNTRNTVTETVYPPAGVGVFDSSNPVIFTRPLNNYLDNESAQNYLKFDVKLEDSVGKVRSRTASTAPIPVSVANVIPSVAIAPGAAGINFVKELQHIQLANANVTPLPVTSVNDLDQVYIFADTYPTAEITGNISNYLAGNANITSTFGATSDKFIGRYGVLTNLQFTGVMSNLFSGSYRLTCAVDYTTNVVQQQGLVANVDYVTDQAYIAPNNLAVSTPVFIPSSFNANTTQAYQLLYTNFTYLLNLDSPPQITQAYPFDIFANAKLLTVIAQASSTVQNLDPNNGQRGFGTFYNLSSVNKGYFQANVTAVYPNV